MRPVLSTTLAFVAQTMLVTSVIGCGGAGAQAPSKPALRVGATVVTSCPAQPPALDDDPHHMSLVEDRTIERICIFGASSEESKVAIARALAKPGSLREGEALVNTQARVALESILALKSVEDASIAGELRGEGVVVHVSVKERPLIDQVVFQGASAFGDAKLNAKNPLPRDTPLDRRVVSAVVQALKEEYASAGYGAASVEASTEPSPKSGNHVNVRFTIVEGPQWKLAKMTFAGSSKVSDADLRKATELTIGSAFDQDRVERASLLINALYYDRGMLVVKIAEPQREVGADGGVNVTWSIVEGDVYRVGSVHFGKAGAPVEKDLLKEMKTKPSDIFDRSKLVADIARLRAWFEARGKKVEIEPLTELDPKTKKVALTLDVVER